MPLLHGKTDLTSKEWAITALVSQGFTNAQIASETQIEEPLIDDHLRKICEKTGCWNRTEVALWYLKLGVSTERRAHDRRELNREILEEDRKGSRRQMQEPSLRADEQHEINLDE
jgi:DNA-binding CsgD family transcriptional regulator